MPSNESWTQKTMGNNLKDCNLNVGYYSLDVFARMEEKNGKFTSNIQNFAKMFNLLTSIPVRTTLKNMGSVERCMDGVKAKVVEICPRSFSMAGKEVPGQFTPQLFQNPVVIMTLRPEQNEKPVDLLESLKIIKEETWFVLLFVALSFALLTSLLHRNKMLKTLLNHTAINFGMFLKFFVTRGDSKMGKVSDHLKTPKGLVLSFSIFSFFLLAYFDAIFNTNLVVSEAPFVIDRLEDILDPRAEHYKIAWQKGTFLYASFEAGLTPTKKAIWEKAIRNGRDQAVIDEDGIKVSELCLRALENPTIFILLRYKAIVFQAVGCETRLTYKSGRPTAWRFAKEIVSEELLAFAYSLHNDSCKEIKQKAIELTFTSFFEAGIPAKIYTDSAMDFLQNPYEHWECLGLKDFFLSYSQIPITLQNTKYFFVVFFALMLISVLLMFLGWITNFFGTAPFFRFL